MNSKVSGMIREIIPNSVKEVVREQRRRFRVRRRYGSEEGPLSTAAALLHLAVRPARTILFYPSLPDDWQVVYKLCLLNGYRMVNDPLVPHDVVHKHENETFSTSLDVAKGKAINGGSNDISKARVQRVFAEVFGYQLEIDPRTHQGKAVRKSDANYRHDGIIVECPTEPEDEEGVVYQRLVETENEDGFCVDLRVPLYGEEIPLVYRKYRPGFNRFKTFVGGEVVRADEILSPDEIDGIRRVAKRMGLDFGEMDILRDNEDGRIYIVDVNNTPAGPPSKFEVGQQRRAVALLSPAYERLVEAFVSS